jgi:hypothetical protein
MAVLCISIVINEDKVYYLLLTTQILLLKSEIHTKHPKMLNCVSCQNVNWFLQKFVDYIFNNLNLKKIYVKLYKSIKK